VRYEYVEGHEQNQLAMNPERECIRSLGPPDAIIEIGLAAQPGGDLAQGEGSLSGSSNDDGDAVS
jgi:hypothetical protein